MNKRKGSLAQAKSIITFSQPQLFSIANQLRYGLVLLVVFSLLLAGGILIYLSFQAQLQQLIFAQQERSHAAANEINAYLDDLQRKLGYLARVPGLADLSPEIQHNLLEGLIRHNTAYQTLAILDHTGEVVTAVSSEGNQLLLNNMADTPLFSRTFKREEDFVGPVEADPTTGLPTVILAVPIRDSQDKVAGVLLAQVNLNFLWFIVSQVNVGETGYAYVIDNRSFLIAEKESSPETFKLENISDRPFLQTLTPNTTKNLTTYVGLKGVEVLGAIAPVRSTHWNVIVELPTAEVYAPIWNMVAILGIPLAIAILLAVGLGVFLTRQVIVPLHHLTEVSAQISAGNMETKVEVTADNEMGLLATTFNRMAAQIRHLVSGLQNHTRRLETITTLNEHLTAILNLEELLVEVVDQIKDKFGYYQVHIYLFDNEQEKLVIAAGTGQASEDLKTIDYTISMNLQTSPVARAAYTGKIVTVGDVSQTEAWLPTPSLPHAYAEMAVPITLGLEGQVVGVLHVQGGQTAGLDENDANLLRSLANQVAVAIRNARLFQEVEIALAKAQATQERYIEQTWRKESRVVAEKGEYYYIGPNATALDEAKKRTLAEAKQQAFVQARPAIVALGENDSQKPNVFEAEMSGSVIAPITLGGKAIGALHLHPGANSRRWTENDLTMIETIINQLAQRAENLRLFEETRERASYERLVGEMTQKIRQSPNLKVLTQTAAEVLNEVLGAAGGEVRLNLSPPAKGGNGHVG